MNRYIMKECKNNSILFTVGVPVLLLLFAANLFWGSVEIPFSTVLSMLCGEDCGNVAWQTILFDVRLPQALTALLAGAAISVSGLVLQTLFNNPLAGPEVLGINNGAALGVAVVMLLSGGAFTFASVGVTGYLAVLLGAFVGAAAIMAVILLLSTMLRNKIFLLIAGVAIGYVTSSAIVLLNYFASTEGVHFYMLWGMGSFGSVSMGQMPLFATLLLFVMLLALLLMKPLNALLLGDAYARNLGVGILRTRVMALAVAGLLSAVVTAYCGPVSFLGLAVPHIARMVFRSNNHNVLIPATMLLGGCVALSCNAICQLPGSGAFLPLSAVTALIGAPVVIYVVLKNRMSR